MNEVQDDIQKIADLENGDSVYEINPIQESFNESDHYSNLADNLSDAARYKLSSTLLEALDEDIKSREKWLVTVEKVKSYLGFSIEDNQIDKNGFTKTYDSTLATALIRFYSLTKAEILPPNGPVDYKILGQSYEELEQQGERLKNYFNHFLTETDRAYYSDFEKLLLSLGIYGSAFKKIFFDSLLGRPNSRFVQPEDFIIDTDCTSILESNRITHILKLTKSDILHNIQNGIYRDADLNFLSVADDEISNTKTTDKDGIDTSVYSNRSLFPVYEIHTLLNLDDFKDGGNLNSDEAKKTIPLPYIVTIDKTSKEILAIRRNWKEADEEKKRIDYFVQYNFLPGFGIYGIGLAQLCGSNAMSLTQILRQLVDAGRFKSLSGGLRTAGFKQQQNDIVITPGEFVQVDTGGMPLQQAFMPLPYSEPSQILHALMQQMQTQTRELSASSEIGLTETNQNMPVGTTLALLESTNRIQSAILGSINSSFGIELNMLYSLFKETVIETNNISPQDFSDNIMIVPRCDPAVNSSFQKIIRAQELLKVASSDPTIHNMREVYNRVYQAFGVQDIDGILKPDATQQQPPIPLDPITENMFIMEDKPVTAAEWQDHDAHIVVHGIQGVCDNPAGAAHIKMHTALKFKVAIQQAMGITLPPIEELQQPEIQNAIALAAANATTSLSGTNTQEQAQVDPNAIMMAEIKQQQEEVAAREKIANLKAETDVFKAQLDFEKEKAKIASNEAIAELKAETELTKANAT